MTDMWMTGFLQRCAQRGLDPAKVLAEAEKSAAAQPIMPNAPKSKQFPLMPKRFPTPGYGFKEGAATDAAIALGKELTGRPLPAPGLLGTLKSFTRGQRAIGAAKFGIPAAMLASAVTYVLQQRGKR